MDQLYDLPAASKKLGGLSIWTLRDRIEDGLLKPTRIGRRVFIAEADLRAFVEAEQGRSKREPR